MGPPRQPTLGPLCRSNVSTYGGWLGQERMTPPAKPTASRAKRRCGRSEACKPVLQLPADPEKLVDELRANESRPRRLLSQKWAAAGHLDQSRPPSLGRKSVRTAVAPPLRLLAHWKKTAAVKIFSVGPCRNRPAGSGS